MTALLLLAGCLGNDTDDLVEVVGCDDEASLTYDSDVTNSMEELCVYEDVLENSIVDFINMIEDGPNMETLDSTVGYSMEVSEAANGEVWHYMETVLVSSDGYKLTVADTYGDEYSSGEIIMSGNEIQYHLENDTQDYTVRMKHTGTFEDAYESMMSDDEDEMMDDTEGRQSYQLASMEVSIDGDTVIISITGDFSSDPSTAPYYTMMLKKQGNSPEMALISINEDDYYNDWNVLEDGYAEQWITTDWLLSGNFEVEFSSWLYGESSDTAVASSFTFYVPEDNSQEQTSFIGDISFDGAQELQVELDDDGNPVATFYTSLYNPISTTISDFTEDETGYTFMGSLNNDFSPFDYLEIHTDSNFTMLGFTLEDTEEEDNWVEFMMLDSGDTSTDESIPLSALPYILIDMSDMSGDGDGESGDGTYWEPYYGGYCEWEGNPDDDERWSCKEDESDSYWEDWWYYCELHEGDWFCTDDYGQSSEYANSADNDRYTNGYDGGDDGGSDDEFMCDSGETIPWDWVNDGYDDCEDGSDEWDDGGSDDEFMCDSGETIPWDWVNDGVDDCQDGSDEWDDGPEEEFHFYDNCTDDNGTYECWMDEWDYDNDGEFDESHGFDYADCSLESNGSWKCFVGYDDEWDDSEEINTYYCLPFVNYNAEGFSIFNITNLDSSICGELVEDEMYEFDLNETWTMPTHLIWEDCWIEGNETICEQGEIYYDVNTTMLWETTHENNYMDCDGDYDNNTSMCTEWIGNVTESDGSAFLVVNDYEESLTMYQYDESTHSGLIIFVQSEYDEDGEWSFDRELQDCDSDGDMMVSYSELEACIDVDLSNDGFDYLNASLVGAYEVFNMTDMDNDGMLNESEFNELNVFLSNNDDDDMNLDDMFDMLDIDSDGEVTASEWAEMSNQSGEEEMSEEDFDNLSMMIDMFDDDYSGGLNFEEFVNMMENMDDMGDDDDDMDPEMMFDMFDANGDGEVTASEWSDFANQTDEPMSEEDFGYLSAMMDNYDDDDSGGLDFDEFMTFMSEMEDMEDSEPDVAMYMAIGLFEFAGADVDDYMVELAMCEGESLLDMECEDPVYSRVLADIMVSSEEEAMMAMMTDSMVFVDSDGSGTLTNGDFVMINKDNLDVDGDWNFARLYSSEAGAYSDDNPMMHLLPGFTGFIATIGLLGAALIRSE